MFAEKGRKIRNVNKYYSLDQTRFQRKNTIANTSRYIFVQDLNLEINIEFYYYERFLGRITNN